MIASEALCGIYAFLGGLCGKLVVSSYGSQYNSFARFLLAGICISLMITLNSACLLLHVKSMQSGSALKATIASSAVNFVLSGVAGVIIFGEENGLMWWIGLSLISLGLAYIQDERPTTKSAS